MIKIALICPSAQNMYVFSVSLSEAEFRKEGMTFGNFPVSVRFLFQA